MKKLTQIFAAILAPLLLVSFLLVSSILAPLLLASCSTAPYMAENAGTPVDLGLSVLWADHNLGAADETGGGMAMAWGDSIRPGRRSGRDKAAMAWGKAWRTPTIAEVEELIDSCRWTWRSRRPSGYIVTGPSGNSVFFPYTSSGYWTSERKPADADFAMYMYFNSAYPDLSFTEPTNSRLLRPVMAVGKGKRGSAFDKAHIENGAVFSADGMRTATHTALAEILQREAAEAASGDTARRNDVLDVTTNLVLPLVADSIYLKPFATVRSSGVADGCHVMAAQADCFTLRFTGVSAFSVRVRQLGAATGRKRAVVGIDYMCGDKQESFEEEIETPDAPHYDIPAILTDPAATTTLTLRPASGRFAVESIHMLTSYSKAEIVK